MLTYIWPRFQRNPNLTLSFSGLYDNSRDVRTFSYKRVEGSVRLDQRLSKGTKLSWSYTNRRVSVDQATLKISPFLIPLLSQPVRLGLISGSLIQDHRDDPVDPHKGYYFSVDLGLAEHIFGSQRNFLRLLARHSSYYKIGKRLVLARNTVFGEILAFDYTGTAYDSIPLPERFYSGGDTTDRGFPPEQAGPRDPNTGFPIGGTAMLFNQTELRFPLIGENIGVVLFHDMGNTFQSAQQYQFPRASTWAAGFQLHGARRGNRHSLSHAGGAFARRSGLQHQSAEILRIPGTLEQLLNAGVNPCATPGACTQTSISHFQYFFSIGQTF